MMRAPHSLLRGGAKARLGSMVTEEMPLARMSKSRGGGELQSPAAQLERLVQDLKPRKTGSLNNLTSPTYGREASPQ